MAVGSTNKSKMFIRVVRGVSHNCSTARFYILYSLLLASYGQFGWVSCKRAIFLWEPTVFSMWNGPYLRVGKWILGFTEDCEIVNRRSILRLFKWDLCTRSWTLISSFDSWAYVSPTFLHYLHNQNEQTITLRRFAPPPLPPFGRIVIISNDLINKLLLSELKWSTYRSTQMETKIPNFVCTMGWQAISATISASIFGSNTHVLNSNPSSYSTVRKEQNVFQPLISNQLRTRRNKRVICYSIKIPQAFADPIVSLFTCVGIN